MPVRSLASSVLKWPAKRTVDQAVRTWAKQLASADPQILGIAYFGSYARGDWGVGSDLDLVIIVAATDRPFEKRGLDFDTGALPVPADVLVYTLAEWQYFGPDHPFFRRLQQEAVWVYGGG